MYETIGTFYFFLGDVLYVSLTVKWQTRPADGKLKRTVQHVPLVTENDILKSFHIALVAGILKSNGINSRIKMLVTWCLLEGNADKFRLFSTPDCGNCIRSICK
jgi:hypothetical protein